MLYAKFKWQILPDPTLILSIDFNSEPVNYRCSKLPWAFYLSDKNLLFLPMLYNINDTVSLKAMLTLLAIKQFIFFSFFGQAEGNNINL